MPKFAPRARIALAIATALPAAAGAQSIEWTATPAASPGEVQLQIERNAPNARNSHSSGVAAANLRGLDLARDGDQRFTFSREAGAFDCTGAVRQRRGSGSCSFTPDARFSHGLARLGMARPDARDSFTLTMIDAHLVTAQALTRFGGRPTLGEFVSLSVQGATTAWLDDLAGAGQRDVKAGELVAYRVQGVTGGWLRALIAADPALAKAAAGEVVAMRIHGVQPLWVRGLADAGYRNLSANDLVAMRIHNVSPEFVRAATAMGGKPSAHELIAQRITGRR